MDPVPFWMPYCGPAPDPASILTRWNGDPWLWTLMVVALAAVFLFRAERPERRLDRGLALAALGVLAVVFISPLCALSSALFSARTAHHLLLVLAAAPLIAAALPRLKTRHLFAATAVQAGLFWAWHAPAAYEAALSNDLAYWMMQASILGSAVWFWRAVRAASAPAAIAALLAAMILMGLLGALITFAGQPIYAPHLATTQAWGLTPLADQQAAGLIMWAPAAAAYLFAALWVLNRLLSAPVQSPPSAQGPRPA